jgi:exosome complex RNA-binding protein Csl4
MPPKIYINDEFMGDKDQEEQGNEVESANSEAVKLGNKLLSIQVESEAMDLQIKKDVDKMINQFLGNYED